MLKLLQVIIALSSVFVIKFTGPVILLSLVFEPAPDWMLGIGALCAFIAGAISLFVGFGESHFSNKVLVSLVVVTTLGTAFMYPTLNACPQTTQLSSPFLVVFCQNKVLLLSIIVLVVAVTTLLVLRKFNGNSEPPV